LSWIARSSLRESPVIWTASFLYLARGRQPSEAEQIKALGIPGVYLSREYRRYYPSGEVAGHILGFTNVDDAGQEVSSSRSITGWREDGAKRVIQDRYGRIVQDVEAFAGSPWPRPRVVHRPCAFSTSPTES